ncbi:MAG: hypothetical protein AVDCRST_MAG17-2338 [uncultured Solirubrobacterales bacterium]|uniref:DUF4367 domain-containing protein n=1 Tax=uncultured Solirubrobacterales bacterium TaxID=768556 RepID=A0A6J4T9D1_9ACTN|nr:MAG: hypothetical protein AVDCRST_MAG17-2338 [uncultured Solirubrobacterales bacterium]
MASQPAPGADEEPVPRSGRRLRWAVVLLAVLLLGVVVALAVTGSRGGSGEGSRSDAPREVSVRELRDFAAASESAVYWAGAIPGRRLELTTARGGSVFVRYLRGDAVVGDERPAFTTVGTYAFDGAYREVQRRGEGEGTETREAPGGGLATWSKARPSSVYLAFPGSDLLVEVYDPDPQRARTLALSGEVGPVR